MHMKMFLVTIKILLIGFIEVGAQEADQVNFIMKLNDLRRETAKKFEIGDMHELIFDESLKDLAGQVGADCPEDHSRRCYSLDDYNLNSAKTQIGKFHTRKEKDTLMDDDIMRSYVGWVLVNPLQTKVGCAVWSFSITETKNLCILGDQETLSGYKGPRKAPGSKCSAGYQNNDGLCVKSSAPIRPPGRPTPPTETSKDLSVTILSSNNNNPSTVNPRKPKPTESPEDIKIRHLITELNEERRKRAEQDERKNMHELTILEYVVNVAKKGRDNFTQLADRRFYRELLVKSHEGIRYLKDSTTEFNTNKSEDEQKEMIKTGNESSLPALDYLLPLQRYIGCATMKLDSDGFDMFCVLHPEGTLNSWNISLDSGCVQGFHFNDSLCVPDPPWEYVPATTVETELDRIIAKYKKNEKEGDLPDKEGAEDDGASVNYSVIMIIVVFVVLGLV